MTGCAEVPIIELKSIVKRFGGNFTALDDVSLSVYRNEVVALVGESGSGKSTLGRIALGLVAPDSGTVELKGQLISEMSAAEYRKKRMVVQPVFQDSHGSLNPRRTIRNALYQAMPGSTEEQHLELLRNVGLNPPARFLSRFPHELSGGQRQRFSIARAISANPELIIADEPLSGADVSIRGQVLNLLEDLGRSRNTAYLMITHDISIARVFADRVAVMQKGRIVEEGLPEDVLGNPKQDYTKSLVNATPDLSRILSHSHKDA